MWHTNARLQMILAYVAADCELSLCLYVPFRIKIHNILQGKRSRWTASRQMCVSVVARTIYVCVHVCACVLIRHAIALGQLQTGDFHPPSVFESLVSLSLNARQQ